MICARTSCRFLYITGLSCTKFKVKLMLVLVESSPAQWVVVVRIAFFLLNKMRCVGLGSVIFCLRGRKRIREYGGGIILPEIFSVLGKYSSWYLLMF